MFDDLQPDIEATTNLINTRKRTQAAVASSETAGAALDNLEAAKLQQDNEASVGFDIDFPSAVGQNLERSKKGQLDSHLQEQRAWDGKQQFEAQRSVVESLIIDEGLTPDEVARFVTQTKDMALPQIATHADYAALDRAYPVPELPPSYGSVSGSVNFVPYAEDVKKAKEMNNRRTQQNYSLRLLALMDKGMPLNVAQESLNEMYNTDHWAVAGLNDPFVQTAFAFGWGGMKGVQVTEAGIKTAAKKFLASGAKEAAFDLGVRGAMTAAEIAGSPVSVQVLSGIVGPAAASMVLSLSRRGLASWLGNTRMNNPDIYKALEQNLPRNERLWEIAQTLDINPGTVDSSISPVAMSSSIAASGDVADVVALEALGETAILAAHNADDTVSLLARKATGTGDYSPMAIAPEPTTVQLDGQFTTELVDPSPFTADGLEATAENIHNTRDISDGCGFRTLTKFTNAKDFLENLSYRVYADSTVHSGKGAQEALEAMQDFVPGELDRLPQTKQVLNMDRFFKDLGPGLVEVASRQARTAKVLKKNLDNLLTEIYNKGNTRAGKKELDNLLQTGTDYNEVFQPVSGGVISPSTGKTFFVSDDIAERYYKITTINDTLHYMSNASAIDGLNALGYKYSQDRVMKPHTPSFGEVDVNGVTWTDELAKEAKAFEVVGKDGPTGQFVFTQEELLSIPENIEVVAYRPGFSPIRYDQKSSLYQVSRLSQDAEGNYKVGRVANATTRKEAEDLVGVASATESDVFFAHRPDEQWEHTDFILNDKTWPKLSRLSSKEIEQIKLSLKGELADESLAPFENLLKSVSVKKVASQRKRGKRLRSAEDVAKGIESGQAVDEAIETASNAPLLATPKALSDYYGEISTYVNKGAWTTKATKAFMDTYGAKLGLEHWSDPITATSKIAPEAKAVQQQLKRMAGVPTPERLAARSRAKTTADWMYKRNLPTFGKTVDKYLKDGYMSITDKSMSLGAMTKIGLMNFSQIPIQSTALLNASVYADQPALLSGALADFNSAYINGMIGSKLGFSSKNGEALYNWIKGSGINSAFNYGTVNDAPLTKLGNAAYLPLNVGEGISRGVITFAERRRLIDEIEAGTHRYLGRKDIDGLEFNNVVARRTNRLAGDFSAINKAEMNYEGLTAMMTQFTSWPLHQVGLFFGDGLTGMQKARLWAGWAGAFGADGVPLLWDAVYVGEAIKERTGDPQAVGSTKRLMYEAASEIATALGADKDENKKFLSRFITKGLISASSDGAINVGNRAAMISFTENYQRGLSLERLLGPGAATIWQMGRMANDLSFTLPEMLKAVREGEATWLEAVGKTGATLKPFPGIKNPLMALQEELPGLPNTTIPDRVVSALGITPGKLLESKEALFDVLAVKKASKEWVKYKAVQLAELSRNNPSIGEEVFKDTMQKAMGLSRDGSYLRQLTELYSYLQYVQHLPIDMQVKLIEIKMGNMENPLIK